MGETVSFGGWPNCLKLANDHVELIVTRDVGPRIVWFGFRGGRNELREFPELQGLTGGEEWRVYGGHRLWHAPEVMPRSYQPDNDPVGYEEREGAAVLRQAVEPRTGIRKTLTLELSQGAGVIVTHTLTNEGVWPITTAAWALSIMAPGGTAIVPQPPFHEAGPEHLLPTRSVVLWSYTRPSDPRLVWGDRFLQVRVDPSLTTPTKIGTQASEGWCGYLNQGHFFVKRVQPQVGQGYPDFNCGVEVYTAGDFLELETLGPLTYLEPGQSVHHVENWSLYDNAGTDASEEGITELVRRVRA